MQASVSRKWVTRAGKRIKGQVGWVWSGSCGSGTVLCEWLVGQWIVDVISFLKIFGLCGPPTGSKHLKGRIGFSVSALWESCNMGVKAIIK